MLPTVANGGKRVVPASRTGQGTIDGHVQPKQGPPSPALGADTAEKQDDPQDAHSPSVISSIKPYDPRNDLADETDDASATRFVCHNTESPSKSPDKRSDYQEETRLQDPRCYSDDQRETALLMSDQTLKQRPASPAQKPVRAVDTRLPSSPPAVEVSRNAGTRGQLSA